MLQLWFDKGTLLLKGNVGTPYGKWDSRVGCYRIKSYHYRDVIEYLKESKIPYEDNICNLPPSEQLKSRVDLREYQSQALKKWHIAGNRGVLILPTAAGKTFIALKAIAALHTQTLIVVPTLDLIDQWKKRVSDYLGIEAGTIGGGENTVKMITISTYDSAYLQAEHLGNQFLFIIFDEVHHLASPGYMQIAEMYIAPYRMGLTATYERGDQRQELLAPLVGAPVYSIDIKELAGEHLAPYTYEKLSVELTSKEQKIYDAQMNVFKGYIAKRRIVLRSAADFQKFIMTTGRDPQAREALLARNHALKVALNSQAKLQLLAEKIEEYKKEKILIFTLHNELVYTISRRFLIPAITYQTKREERREILSNFANGKYHAIVTSQVLDEGVDVPDASVGIVLSGTGSIREYIQRLGRILRKVEGKTARLVEIISRETIEAGISKRRRKKTGGV